MKIISYNVNGIRAALKKGFIDWLVAAQPDVICIQETKAHKEQLDLEIFENAGYPYHYLQVYIKTEIDEYFTFTTKVYGSDNIEERLCESIALFDQIEIIN